MTHLLTYFAVRFITKKFSWDYFILANISVNKIIYFVSKHYLSYNKNASYVEKVSHENRHLPKRCNTRRRMFLRYLKFIRVFIATNIEVCTKYCWNLKAAFQNNFQINFSRVSTWAFAFSFHNLCKNPKICWLHKLSRKQSFSIIFILMSFFNQTNYEKSIHYLLNNRTLSWDTLFWTKNNEILLAWCFWVLLSEKEAKQHRNILAISIVLFFVSTLSINYLLNYIFLHTLLMIPYYGFKAKSVSSLNLNT